jgi:mannose-1-phosphate guanylyltransferase
MAQAAAAGTELWATVLAGGEGTRMQPVIRNRLGHDRPKQVCSFMGTRSMLQHTVDRVRDVVPEKKILTVVARNRRTFHETAFDGQAPCRILEQPASRGTACAIFLSASQIMDEDPDATVLILPSDNLVCPLQPFAQRIRLANLLVDRFRDHMVVLCAVPEGPESHYGWVVPGRRKHAWARQRSVPDPREVESFHEKPTRTESQRLYRRGGLWNTMIAVVRVRTLWRLGWQCLPDMMRRFETLRQVIRAVREGRVPDEHRRLAVAHVYAHLEAADFSRDLLERCAGSLLALPMDGIDWSDWGTLGRVTRTLSRIGRRSWSR